MRRTRPHIYGPVSSRRLGASLGVDLVPFKTCNFDCVYCQLGRTRAKTDRTAPYVPADEILAELEAKLASGTRPDYVTMAGSGEPTLNSELARVIEGTRGLTDAPVAVLTNGSLLAEDAVREACLMADLVLPSLDAGDEETFQAVNRPCPGIRLEGVIEGLTGFRSEYSGLIWLEVMMLDGLNSSDESVEGIGGIVEAVSPDEVQLNTVYRPPAEPFARPVPEERMREILALLRKHASRVGEVRVEGGAPAPGSMNEAELLALLERRPCTRAHIADTFGINEIEAMKALSRLIAAARITSQQVGEDVFYKAAHTSTGGAPEG